jgi:hypothetical protein
VADEQIVNVKAKAVRVLVHPKITIVEVSDTTGDDSSNSAYKTQSLFLKQ